MRKGGTAIAITGLGGIITILIVVPVACLLLAYFAYPDYSQIIVAIGSIFAFLVGIAIVLVFTFLVVAKIRSIEKQNANRIRNERIYKQMLQSAMISSSTPNLQNFFDNMPPADFEKFVGDLFRKRDYQVQVIGGKSDGGVDVIARRNGKTRIVQCKRWLSPIGPDVVRELIGSQVIYRADYATIAATNGFTAEAMTLADQYKIRLMSLHDLAMMFDDNQKRLTYGKLPSNY